ncbi:MAG: NADase-type glycan-binding domain-containing protein [Acidimicrobiales bacterium]
MIVCKSCGNQEVDSTSFCGACGAFLEWEGEHVAAPAPDAGFDIEDPEELRKRGVVATVKEALGLDHEEQARLAEEAARKSEAAAEREQAYEAADAADALGQSRAEAGLEARTAADAEARARAREEVASQAQAAAAAAATQAAEAQARATEQAAAEQEAKLEAAARAAQAADDEARQAAEADARAAEVAAAQARARAEAEAQSKADAELRQAREAEAAERAAAAAAVEAETKRQAEARAAAAAEEEAKARAESEERLRRAAALVAPKAPVAAPARRGSAGKGGRGAAGSPVAGSGGAVPAAAGAMDGSAATATEPGNAVVPPSAVTHTGTGDTATGAPPTGGPPTGGPPTTAAPTGGPPTTAAPGAGEGAQPEAVLPGMAQRRPRAVRAAPAPRRAEPGDLICGQCGTFNDSERKFCRHCGASLAEAATVKLSWWKRLRAWSRRRRVRSLGARPTVHTGVAGRAGELTVGVGRIRRVWVRWKRWVKRIIGLAIVAIVVLALVPGTNPIKTERQKLFGQVKALNGKPVTLYPSGAVATSSVPGHPATDAINLSDNIAWYSAPSSSGGTGQTITVSFASPTAVDRVGVISGAYQAAFDVESRPLGVALTFLDPAGKVVAAKEVELADVATFQQVAVKATDVAKVKVQVLSVYRGAGNNGVAIASLQFFRIAKP